MTIISKTMHCSHCGGPVTREGARWVCHYDGCPLNIAAQKAYDRSQTAAVIGGFIGLAIRYGVLLGLLYWFVRWAAGR